MFESQCAKTQKFDGQYFNMKSNPARAKNRCCNSTGRHAELEIGFVCTSMVILVHSYTWAAEVRPNSRPFPTLSDKHMRLCW